MTDNLLAQLWPRLGLIYAHTEDWHFKSKHYCDVRMCAMASQITSRTIVYSTDYSGAHHRQHQSTALLAFVQGIHRWPVNSPHKWPVTRKLFPFDDVIMALSNIMRNLLPAFLMTRFPDLKFHTSWTLELVWSWFLHLSTNIHPQSPSS